MKFIPKMPKLPKLSELNPKKIISSYKERAKKFKDLDEEEKTHYDQSLMQWQTTLYPSFDKSKRWYIVAGIITTALVIYGIATNQWTFSVVVLITAGVYYYLTHEETPVIEVKVSDIGIKIGERVYPYTDIRTFWIEYNPPYFQNLHLVSKNEYKQEITAQIHGINPSELRRVLTRYLPEWTEREKTFTESISQILGL